MARTRAVRQPCFYFLYLSIHLRRQDHVSRERMRMPTRTVVILHVKFSHARRYSHNRTIKGLTKNFPGVRPSPQLGYFRALVLGFGLACEFKAQGGG